MEDRYCSVSIGDFDQLTGMICCSLSLPVRSTAVTMMFFSVEVLPERSAESS